MAQESWNCDTAEGSGCQQQPDGLVPCPNNCGFFGCSATMNLCSKCFLELTLQKQAGHVPSDKVAVMTASAGEKTLISAGKHEASGMHESSSAGPVMATSSPVEESGVFQALSAPSPHPRSSSPATLQSRVLSLPDLQPVSTLFATDVKEQAAHPVSRRQGVNRCFNCRKRTGLLGFKCRCGYLFCAQHRYSDKHGCAFDYKSAGREAIAKANPIVKAQKVEKI